MVFQHLVHLERVWDLGALEEIDAADFVLLLLLVPPHGLDAEPKASGLVVGPVDEALALVVGGNFVLEFLRSLVESKVPDTDFFFILVFP